MDKEEIEKQIDDKLHRLVKPSYINEWYDTKIPALNFRTPREMIQNRQGEEVLKMISQINDGVI